MESVQVASTNEAQIAKCLAYEVLLNPDEWIGGPSTELLHAFLVGAELRFEFTKGDISNWQIAGVLNDPTFYQQFIDATGHPTLTIRWAKALALTHFSLAAGFETLKRSALEWHRAHGPLPDVRPEHRQIPFTPSTLWSSIARRPPMYMGDASGWTLYCFLNGMANGGDWLQLPAMPGLQEVFSGIQERSRQAYGSPFAAFRMYNAQDLLGWVGLPSNKV